MGPKARKELSRNADHRSVRRSLGERYYCVYGELTREHAFITHGQVFESKVLDDHLGDKFYYFREYLHNYAGHSALVTHFPSTFR